MAIDRESLPQTLEACHALISELVSQLDVKERKLQRIQHQLEQLLRWRYGQKRERVDENQLFLFAAELVATDRDLPPAKKSLPAKGQRDRPGHGRRRLPAHLERRRQVYDLAPAERQCPECGEALRHIGEDLSERLEYVPASLFVIQEASQKYACHKGCTVVTAAKPMQPIEKGLPGPGLLAHVTVNKYSDHLPLHRQEQMFQRQGVALSRKTMCGWMARCAALLAPLVDEMKTRALSSKTLQTDDTPVAVLDPQLPRTRTGRIWTYVGDQEHPYTVYDYTPNWSRDGPEAFLRDFRGFLQADAYKGYDGLYTDPERGITEVACWAHTRRRFYEAQSSDLMRSMVMLAYIRLLYDVERDARDQKFTRDQRYALRQERAVPILADIKSYLEREQPAVLPKSPEGQAIAYTLSNWEALIRYCEDGDLAIDNNAAERSLRGVAVGRRNWTFFGGDSGGHTAAILNSVIMTCKRHQIDPFAYLRDVYDRISAHPASQIAELLPDIWKTAQANAPS